MLVLGYYVGKELRTGIRSVSKAPGICTVKRRVNGRLRIVGAVLPGKVGTRTKIGRP